jgi:ribosomal protein L10
MFNIVKSASGLRSYATLGGKITPERAKQLTASPSLNKHGNKYGSWQVFRHELYLELLSKPGVLLIQRMNPTTREWKEFQGELLKFDVRATMIQKSIFTAAARHVSELGGVEDKMVDLLFGPISVLAFDANSQTVGPTLQSILSLLSKSVKFQLLGGKVEGGVYSLDELIRITKLPSISQMHSQMLGILEQPVRDLLTALEGHQGEVVRLLESHKNHTTQNVVGVLSSHESNLKQ